ncbi:NADPH:quinone reductase [Nocardioides sp. GY 10127]|uniref:NADPH:quinone reductase n=1 Tax=Nocardioides sp. GY 10127 TaxID=2569762 RepID=UPI0010A7A88F|nr:NADPH:quinone reductase [Nocardioides sp. GY 10127]TIC85471.1 NADPH:quinone reductase [Nocardioides sp. GY 10127]
MRAVVYSETGPSSVLSLVERPLPEPGPGEVRVRVLRAGVNPTDWKFRASGMNGDFAEVSPGQDAAGLVDAVGEGVEGLRVGERVWTYLAQAQGRAYGTALEHTVLPASHVVPLPVGASYDLGASLGVPAMTAHRALTSGEDVSRVAPGSMSGMTVLVQGGAGAVGNAAIQLARWAGAQVVATVSSEKKAALAVAAGAHQTVNYRAGSVPDALAEICPEGVDLVVEVALAQNLADDLAVLRNRGTIAFYGALPGDEAVMPVRDAMMKNVRLQGAMLYFVGADLLEVAAADVVRAVDAGALRVGRDAGVPLHHYALEETAAAHDAVEAGAVGKVLLTVGEE